MSGPDGPQSERRCVIVVHVRRLVPDDASAPVRFRRICRTLRSRGRLHLLSAAATRIEIAAGAWFRKTTRESS
jgi:hypothetical protein